MSRHIGRHRMPRPARPVAPLAPTVTKVEAASEGLFTALRHLEDGRTVDDAWALAEIDTADILTAQASAA